MRRRPPIAAWVAALAVAAATSLSVPALAAPVEATAAEPHRRPYEAPVFERDIDVPALPPMYLKQEEAGIALAYHPSARERVRTLVHEAVEMRVELSTLLGVEVLDELRVRVAVGGADFDRVLPAEAPRGARVVALSDVKLLVLGLQATPERSSEVREAIRLGMAHLALDEAAGPRAFPHWFRVGFALHVAEDGGSMARDRTLWWASMQRRMIPVVDLDHHLGRRAAPVGVASAEAADFVGYLAAVERREGFRRLVQVAGEHEAFDDALAVAYSRDGAALERGWREQIAKHKAFVPLLAGGLLLWVLVAGAVQFGRHRRRGRDEETETEVIVADVIVAEHAQSSDMEPTRAEEPAAQEPSTHERDPDERDADARDPVEVPKVSHDGDWHTLH